MQTLNLQRIIDSAKLDKRKLAVDLFPENTHPILSLNRVLSGKSELNASQISKLSELTGIPVGELFNDGWTIGTDEHTIIFTSKLFEARFDTNTGITRIFERGSLMHTSMINSKFIPLNEYIAELNRIINTNHSKNEKSRN